MIAASYARQSTDQKDAAGTVPLELEHRTDLGNARRLVSARGQDVLYQLPDGPYLTWDGVRFADDAGEVQLERWAQETIYAMHADAIYQTDDETERRARIKHAFASESRRSIAAMVALVRSQPGIPVRPDQLDADPWLLCVLNGTVELRAEARLRPHRREDKITKIVPVNYVPDAVCPTWMAFLERVLDGKAALINFLQRFLGYSLTGRTDEQVLAIAHGFGANGKSVFLHAAKMILGDYGQSVPLDTFLVNKHVDTARPDLARLRGSRLVAAVESDSGRRFAEGLVKMVTGQDTIVARRLYREHFEFLPTFKVVIATNHRPVIRGTDDAIWRRIRLVPFTVTIPPEERDRELPDKLQAEREGILAWAVRGCLEWQRCGLGLPKDVADATAAYKNDMDVLGDFIRATCTVEAKHSSPAGTLYETYLSWAHKANEKPLTKKAFGQALAERGYTSKQQGKDREHTWFGIGLAEPTVQEPIPF
jgi:putative DNA primase/helicase